MGIATACFSPDAKTLLTGSNDGYLCEWDVYTGERRRVLLDPQGKEDERPRIVIVDQNGHEEDAPFQLRRLSEAMRGSSIECVRFSPDGRRFAVGAANGQVAIWNASSRGELFAWQAHRDGVRAIDFAPDAHLVATGSGEEDGTTLRVWEVEVPPDRAPREVFSDGSHVGGVTSLSFSRDSRLLAAGGYAFSGYSGPLLYDLREGKRLGTFLWEVTSALQLSPDAELLASGDDYGTFSLWEVKRQTGIFSEEIGEALIGVVQFSPSGRRVAAGDQSGRVTVWDVKAQRLVVERAFSGAVVAFRFSPDGMELLVAEAAEDASRPAIHRERI
jgi:WD40 repeat protein